MVKNKLGFKSKKETKFLASKIKSIFISRQDIAFYLLYFLVGLLVFCTYFNNLTAFALKTKIFTLSDSAKFYSSDLLSEHFKCSSITDNLYCGKDLLIFLILLLFIEIFTIRKAIIFRKMINKKIIFIYLLIMQIFIFSIGIFILGYTPDLVVNSLAVKARKEIKSAIEIINNPKKISETGGTFSVDDIVKRINNSSFDNFKIYELNPLEDAVLSQLKISRTEKDSLYKSLIIPYELYYSNELKKSKLDFGIIFFPDNSLIINNYRKEDAIKLVPVVANKIVSKFLKSKSKIPRIAFLNDAEYLKYQTIEEENTKNEFQRYIFSMENSLAEIESNIQLNSNIVNSYTTNKLLTQKEYEEYVSEWKDWYLKCKKGNQSDIFCNNGEKMILENTQNLRNNIIILEDNYKLAQKYLNIQHTTRNAVKNDLESSKKNYEELLKNPVSATYSDAAFNAPNLIYVKYFDDEARSLTSYVGTAMHEYFHFYSYNPNSQDMDIFLKEGINEYLKYVSLLNYSDITVPQVYYEEVEIVKELIKYFPEEKIIEFYLGMDQESIKQLFISKYSSTDYADFIDSGKKITFTSPEDTTLKSKYLEKIKNILSK